MSEEEARRVFDEDFKTRNQESRKLNPYSHGIGLGLCNQLCQSLDGMIKVKSAIGVGSKFTFTMRVKGTSHMLAAAQHVKLAHQTEPLGSEIQSED